MDGIFLEESVSTGTLGSSISVILPSVFPSSPIGADMGALPSTGVGAATPLSFQKNIESTRDNSISSDALRLVIFVNKYCNLSVSSNMASIVDVTSDLSGDGSLAKIIFNCVSKLDPVVTCTERRKRLLAAVA